MSFVSAKMLRETDTRGSRSHPASLHASRKARICAACCTWKGSPPSSVFSVELIRFMPSCAAHTAVLLELAPHQMRSRRPAECGSSRSSPGGFGNIGRGLGWANPFAAQHVQQHLGMPARHVGVGFAFNRLVAEVPPPVDDLFR